VDHQQDGLGVLSPLVGGLSRVGVRRHAGGGANRIIVSSVAGSPVS
jgi:hypothetical protein